MDRNPFELWLASCLVNAFFPDREPAQEERADETEPIPNAADLSPPEPPGPADRARARLT